MVKSVSCGINAGFQVCLRYICDWLSVIPLLFYDEYKASRYLLKFSSRQSTFPSQLSPWNTDNYEVRDGQYLELQFHVTWGEFCIGLCMEHPLCIRKRKLLMTQKEKELVATYNRMRKNPDWSNKGKLFTVWEKQSIQQICFHWQRP